MDVTTPTIRPWPRDPGDGSTFGPVVIIHGTDLGEPWSSGLLKDVGTLDFWMALQWHTGGSGPDHPHSLVMSPSKGAIVSTLRLN